MKQNCWSWFWVTLISWKFVWIRPKKNSVTLEHLSLLEIQVHQWKEQTKNSIPWPYSPSASGGKYLVGPWSSMEIKSKPVRNLFMDDSIFPWCESLREPQKMGSKNKKIAGEPRIFVPWMLKAANTVLFPGSPHCKLYKFQIFYMAVFFKGWLLESRRKNDLEWLGKTWSA